MLNEQNIEEISQKLLMLVSLSRILENIYNNSDEISSADIWALINILNENLEELLNYIRDLKYKTVD